VNESGTPRVAVYLDFDNIVISRYDQIHGRNSFQRDKTAGFHNAPGRLTTATVDVGAIIDFASSFGTLVLTKAYADWSVDVNAEYRGQLVGRAVDLVQLFPAAAYAKNGADIRLAVDAVEDMFRLPDLTHVVIVAGDSDYIALAQRCKRLGRYVVGIGITGSIGHEKDDADWLHNSAVKAQMKRMDPSFSEKSLGFKSFSDFLRSRTDVVDLDESSTTRLVRLKPAAT
jgi:uncharacterized LabA/DUF88 family protein